MPSLNASHCSSSPCARAASISSAWFALKRAAASAGDVPEPRPKPTDLGPAVASAPIAAEPIAYTPTETLAPRPETRVGASGLPVPRFVSLKSGEVYLREGPSPQHKVDWVYVRRGLPVEVIAEYDVWRRIRDADGVVGWVHKQMLDGRRSVLMTGADNVAMRDRPNAEGAVIAYAEPGVIAQLKACGGAYCEVEAGTIDAYVPRERVWGVYDDETVE